MSEKAERNAATPSVRDEFEAAWFPDVRLSRRLLQISEAAEQKPDSSFPKMVGSEAELEGTYRFLNNPAVAAEGILSPHFHATVERAAEQPQVLVLHDTSEFRFGGESIRDGLGVLAGAGDTRGFYGHFSLAVAPGETADPLGLLAVHTWTRTGGRGKRSPKKLREDGQRESLRWANAAQVADRAIQGRTTTVHVMDREADTYETLDLLQSRGSDFVVRSSHDRCIVEEDASHLRERLDELEYTISRTVKLSRRRGRKTTKGGKPKASKIHPPRDRRDAELQVAACEITFKRTVAAGPKLNKTVTLNVVRVREPSPPEGEQPVDWVLITTLDISTREKIEEVVDIYRVRWLIEEFFKALKTGCAFEKRQLGSLHALLNALAILSPVAWRLLRIRSLSRSQPDRPAADFLTPAQLEILRRVPKKPLGPDATVQQAFFAIARLGGFLDRNGRPGWRTLGLGFEELLTLERGYLAALSAGNCDQS